MQRSQGAGQTSSAERTVDAADVVVPPGFRIEAIAENLTFPTGVAFDEDNIPHVTEAGYSYGEGWTTPRLLRIEPDGSVTAIAAGGDNGPWTGVCFQVRHGLGAMPAFSEEQIAGGQLDDLVAYVLALRRLEARPQTD